MAQKIRLNFSLNCAVFIKKTTSFTISSKKIAAPRYFTVKILKALTLTSNDYIYLCNNKKNFIKLKMSPALYQTHFQIIQSDFCPDFCINVNTGKLLYFVFALFIENRIVYILLQNFRYALNFTKQIRVISQAIGIAFQRYSPFFRKTCSKYIKRVTI